MSYRCYSVSSLRRARAGIFDSVEALADFLLIACAESKDTASAIELVSNVLVHLAEFVELSGNVVILQLDDLGVLLESVLLSKVVNILASKSLVSKLGLIKILAVEDELVITVLKAGLKLSDLSCHVEVAGSSKFVFLSQLIIVSGSLLTITSEKETVAVKTSVNILLSGNFLLYIFEKELLVAKIVTSRINNLLGIFDSHANTRHVIVKCLKSIRLVSSFTDSALIEILELSNLSPVVLSLKLKYFHLLFQVGGLKSEIRVSIALFGVILVQSQRFEVAVV